MINLDEVFEILPKEIKTTIDCYTVINRKDYKDNEITETTDTFIIPGILEFYFPDYKDDFTSILLDYPINLHKTDNMVDDDIIIKINYLPNDIVLSQDRVQINKKNIGAITKLLEGRANYIKNPNVLLTLLHKFLPTVDLVHLELILSNMFRTETDEFCRLKGNYTNCKIVGQTHQAKNDSWLSAITYRNIDQGLKKGLIGNKDIVENPIEKVILENFS